MNVTTDPRIIKQLLLSQWMNAANPLETKASADARDGSLFGEVLGGVLNGSLSEDLPVANPSDLGLLLNRLGSGWEDMTLNSLLNIDQISPEAGGSRSDYDGLISSVASRYGMDPALVKAVVQTESGFDPDAMSSVGAKGLMQLMDDTARSLGVDDSFDPAQNIDGGTRFLSYLLRKYDGQITPALAAYNAGPGRVDRLGLTTDEQISQRFGDLPEETQHYIRKVLSAMQHWNQHQQL